jgi:hypothetical protein
MLIVDDAHNGDADDNVANVDDDNDVDLDYAGVMMMIFLHFVVLQDMLELTCPTKPANFKRHPTVCLRFLQTLKSHDPY